MKKEKLFSIQADVLEINYVYQDKARTKKFLVCDTKKMDTLKKYLSLSDPAWIKKNCEHLVENGVLDSRDSLLEELV